MDGYSQDSRLLQDSMMDGYEGGQTQMMEKLWKRNDRLAQKNAPHSAVYWVKKETKNEDGSSKSSKWKANTKYIGDWKNNLKNGFGVQYYGNNDKYEGGWEDGKRNGQGTYWVAEDKNKNKLRREYTGDWQNDQKTGRGTMFYKNGDRYDGLWKKDLAHGEGRMIYKNGDVYEGMWFNGKRSGYGVLTKRNGNHFEGHWINDKREGQGSYFYAQKNQVFVGEWVDDMPKTGVYSEVEDPYGSKPEREKHFTNQYILPPLPQIELKNPTQVLQEALENVRKERTIYRARYIPLDELYSKEEIYELAKQFSVGVVNEAEEKITDVDLQAILQNMNFGLQQEQIYEYLEKINPEINNEKIDFETFARVVAIILEEASNEEENQDVNLQQMVFDKLKQQQQNEQNPNYQQQLYQNQQQYQQYEQENYEEEEDYQDEQQDSHYDEY
ncbi:hypothetical protein PPERSA_01519 [Pseudocohnilembus persalinus]|uniref:MORN repeat-containing protein 3 n=1 Tax=Pseudocohnilembus persalinus TaxID=266149 RepID=A0A0V0R7Q6_PSEPJ|nr:hypothetical protein PPERSA_01519 [Pseudocohnilembus persalinus]|eukprot:KRX10507.1 hypothetical protein PPERSA_01519 [Pseudocohnilembus persalinus]